ncbi:MAG: radical SAM family heme chaperone HemW [Alphaproteobacteria bacterium]
MSIIYIHYPYCLSKCPYCDFNSHVSETINFTGLKQAYQNELEYFANNVIDKNITTIFFGGGTTSLMPTALVADILTQIHKLFSVDNNAEISLEANPTSVEAQKFQELKKIGVNRLSLGIQALNNDDLKFLGRKHDKNEAEIAIQMAQKYFDNFSFDLIYARPNQNLQDWLNELSLALKYQAPHMSLYQLTIEKGTKFYAQYQQQKFSLPDENLASNLFEATNSLMEKSGYLHYEVSNYAKAGFQCRHNLGYWQSQDYIGVGAGAHSRVFFKDKNLRQAIIMEHEPNNWIQKSINKKAGIQSIQEITKNELIEEFFLMGLRLESGVLASNFYQLTKLNFVEIFNQKKLNFLLENNFLKITKSVDDTQIFIPKNQMILSQSIILKLIEALEI